MANYFNLTLDTTGPASPSISLEGGAQYATSQLIDATLGTADGDTTGYQMKLWGDIDLTWGKANGVFDSEASDTTESDAIWITYSSTKQIKLSDDDGEKTVYAKIRDDVHNPSSQVSDSIVLDTTLPVVTITGPDVSKISKQSGKDECAFSFTADDDYVAYKVKVVSSTGAAHDTGTQIPTTAGSTNMSGEDEFDGEDPVECIIKGADLETASSGDGTKIIKVFVQDDAGNWSA